MITTVPFGELFSLIRNGLSVKQDKSGDGLPITRIETISAGVVDAERVGFAGLSLEEGADWLLQDGDILFSHINSVDHIGKCAVYRREPELLVHGMNLLCLRADVRRLQPEYAKWLIRSSGFRSRLSNFVNKAVNQASVSIGNLRTIPVVVPSVQEQRRIAAILDQAEALRAKRRQSLAKLDTLTQSLFLEMFGDPVSNYSGWQSLSVGEALQQGLLLEVQDGNHGEVHPKAAEFTDQGIPFLTANCLVDGEIDLELCNRLPERFLKTLRVGFVQSYDALLSHKGTVGSTAVVPESSGTLIASPQVTYYRVSKDRLSPVFLAGLFRSLPFQMKLSMMAEQSTRAYIGITRQESLPLIVPPMDLQRSFTTKVESLMKLKEVSRTSLQALAINFTSIQHRAFRREL